VEKRVGPSHPRSRPRPCIRHQEVVLNSDAPANKRKLIGMVLCRPLPGFYIDHSSITDGN
jgi:hypothetical protein